MLESIIPKGTTLLPLAPEENPVFYIKRMAGITFESRATYSDGSKISYRFPRAMSMTMPEILELVPFPKLLRNYLPFPLHRPYLDDVVGQQFAAHYLDTPLKSVATKVGMAPLPAALNGVIQICTHCLRNDLCVYSAPICRRIALIPWASHCPWHQTRFERVCGRCFFYSSSMDFRELVGLRCRCGRLARPRSLKRSSKTEERLLQLTLDVQKQLEGALLPFTRERISYIYWQRARDLGLITPHATILLDAVRSHIEASGMKEWMDSLGFLANSTKNALPECMTGRRAVASPLLHGVTQQLLFDGLDGFLQQLKTPDERNWLPAEIERKIARIKRKIIAAIDDNPGITRTQLLSYIHCRERRLINQYASDWYDDVLPSRHAYEHVGRAIPAFHSPAAATELDAACVAHIFMRHKEILSEPDFPIISRTALLRRWPGASIFNKRKAAMPASASLLTRLSETAEQHSLRVLKTVMPQLQNPEKLSHRTRLRHIGRWRRSRK